jgi:hypothetical protein
MTPLNFPTALRRAAVIGVALLAASQAPASQRAGGDIGSVLKSSPASGARTDKPKQSGTSERSHDGKPDASASDARSATKR